MCLGLKILGLGFLEFMFGRLGWRILGPETYGFRGLWCRTSGLKASRIRAHKMVGVVRFRGVWGRVKSSEFYASASDARLFRSGRFTF